MNFTARKATLAELIQLHEKGELVGVFDLTPADYHSAPGISKSGLDDVAESPATFRYRRENPEEATDEMDFGNACHTAILEPSLFKDRYAVAGVELDRRGTKAWKELEAANPGKSVLKFDAASKIEEMAHAVRSHSRASLLDGLRELSFFWKDAATGLLCKCRPDVLTAKGAIVDYKSAANIWPKRLWEAALFRQRYHVQGPFYLDGVAAAVAQSGVTLPVPIPDTFIFLAQLKTAPYLVKPWKLGHASALLGQRTYVAELKIVAECEKSGVWGGFPEHIEDADCPEYAWTEELGDDDGGDL